MQDDDFHSYSEHLYAYQVVPGSDKHLSFSDTLEQCRVNARELGDYMRDGPERNSLVGHRVIYKIYVSNLDKWGLIERLNLDATVFDAFIARKEAVEVLT